MTSEVHKRCLRKAAVIDRVIAQMQPGQYPLDKFTEIYNKEVSQSRARINNRSMALLFRPREDVRFVSPGIWEVLPRSQETPAAKEGVPA